MPLKKLKNNNIYLEKESILQLGVDEELSGSVIQEYSFPIGV